MQVPQYYDNVPENFLGQKTKKNAKRKKKGKKRKSRKSKLQNDNLQVGQYYRNQSQAQAWAITTGTIPGLLTREKNLNFENRILTNTLPRHRGEIENPKTFVDKLAWSQQRVNKINKRLLIDKDDPVRRNLLNDFDRVAELYPMNAGPEMPPNNAPLPPEPPAPPGGWQNYG